MEEGFEEEVVEDGGLRGAEDHAAALMELRQSDVYQRYPFQHYRASISLTSYLLFLPKNLCQ